MAKTRTPKTTKTTKTAKKPAAKKPAKSNGPALGKVHVRILRALAKSGKPMSRTQLAKAAQVHPSVIGKYAGYVNPDINARPVHSGNLLNQGMVKIEAHPDGTYYAITPKGRKAV